MLIEVKSSNRDLLTDSTSGLSPQLSAGELDPRDVLREINLHLAKATLKPAEETYPLSMKRQLIFREFARSALEVQEYRFPEGAYDKNSDQLKLLLSGDTGIPIINACLTDLKNGLPHNRARLLLARFAIRNLNLMPELVADLFRRSLKDYCPTINTFNIVSAASAATFAEPWYRLSNPVTAAKKLDPENQYIARFGYLSQNPTADGEDIIRDGSNYWISRWKEAKQSLSYILRRLWPTRDKERGIFFILNLIPARGAFSPYYKKYLEHEDELIES